MVAEFDDTPLNEKYLNLDSSSPLNIKQLEKELNNISDEGESHSISDTSSD